MTAGDNPLFKFISFRAPLDGLEIDAGEGADDSEVVAVLRESGNDVTALPSRILDRLSGSGRLTSGAVESTLLNDFFRYFDSHGIDTPGKLEKASLKRGESKFRFREYARSDRFRTEHALSFDFWVLKKLQKEDSSLRMAEQALRAAHLGYLMREHRERLLDPGRISRILISRIVLPERLRKTSEIARKRAQRYEKEIEARRRSVSALRDAITKEEKRFAQLERRIVSREGIRSKAARVRARWLADRRNAEPEPARPAGTPVGGLVNAISGFFRGSPRVNREHLPSQRTPDLDDRFYSALKAELTDDEEAELSAVAMAGGGALPSRFDDLVLDAFGTHGVAVDANDACARIRVWESELADKLPPARQKDEVEARSSVRAIGWGDLVVARQTLVGYEAREIAHIENVLPGEDRLREHERQTTREEILETETEEETESERDLQTTDRYELQSESQKTIDEEFSVEAGVNTSGRYGLTKVDRSLDVGFQRSSSEAESSSVSLAREIVSRAVERVFESTRKLRRVSVVESIRELNRHGIRNSAEDGTPGDPQSGVYLWVEKIEEVELRHYGTRLMVEFHIPEPALSLLENEGKVEVDVRKPAPFTLGPNDVSPANYMCLTKLFGAQDVEPPPAQFLDVGYTWKSAPDEDSENNAEDTASDTIAIPDGYRPITGDISISSVPWGKADRFFYYVAVGGEDFLIDERVHYRDGWEFDPAAPWPNGVPVSLAAHGHFDKTLALHVTIYCERTDKAMKDWQLRTWERIREAHQVLMREYQEAVTATEFEDSALIPISSRPGSVNRKIERDELKKWAVKTIRIDPFDFDAVAQEGDYQEIDPLDSDLQAPIVRFFEEAFEWRQMSYFFYPYFWGRRDAWRMRLNISHPDSRHEAFLKAGSARVVVPVSPGYEDRVLNYLDSDPGMNELERIKPVDLENPPGESEAQGFWLELLINRNEQLALGSGTLDVTKSDSTVRINDDSSWRASDRDPGRELFIAGDRYVIASVTNESEIEIDREYMAESDQNAVYATGSLPFGSPWLVRTPTSLVVLAELRSKVQNL